ncbi:MAG TPA: carboxypeptidase regulatory-like domain-containing protein [Polyangiaceae bacterium]|nr:carboxypeptidase regulatory-like domain-containing protein [Polyangiaceae bacterium]
MAPIGVGPCVGLCLLASAASSRAQSVRLGPDLAGSTGFFRVPVVALAPRGVDVGGGVGYGYTEPLSTAPGAHHRIGGRATASVTPLDWLGVSIGSNLRHDRHPGDPLGPDTGTVLDSDLLARAGAELDDFHLGLGASAWFTRGRSLGASLEKPSLTALALAAWVPRDIPFSLGVMAGYRYDPSASAIDDPERYRSGDRLSLGVSSFDAIPLGIGAAYRFADVELVAELSADTLIGNGAPEWKRSPLRASAGARYHLSERIALRLLTDTSLSARPTPSMDALMPVEPRFQVLLGMSCRLLSWDESAPETAPAPPPEPEPAPAAALATLEVAVTTSDGYPLSDATLSLEIGGRTLSVPHVDMQTYRLDQLPLGKGRLRVEAERLAPQVVEVELSAAHTNQVRVQLAAAASVDGQVRGVVRSFDGNGLAATVRIEPLGKRVSTDRDGAFQLDLPPGKYDVVIEARGHLTQRRSIDVRGDGVVVLNADLSRSAP